MSRDNAKLTLAVREAARDADAHQARLDRPRALFTNVGEEVFSEAPSHLNT